jgi:hypothetical protein
VLPKLSIIGRHIEEMRSDLPALLSLHGVSSDAQELGSTFIQVAELLTSFSATKDRVVGAAYHAEKRADLLWDQWPTQKDMFPYHHLAKVEVRREVESLFARYAIGPGYISAQGVEKMGGVLKRATPRVSQDPKHWLPQLVAEADMRFAHENGLLEVLDEDDNADGHESIWVVEVPRLKPKVCRLERDTPAKKSKRSLSVR